MTTTISGEARGSFWLWVYAWVWLIRQIKLRSNFGRSKIKPNSILKVKLKFYIHFRPFPSPSGPTILDKETLRNNHFPKNFQLKRWISREMWILIEKLIGSSDLMISASNILCLLDILILSFLFPPPSPKLIFSHKIWKSWCTRYQNNLKISFKFALTIENNFSFSDNL